MQEPLLFNDLECRRDGRLPMKVEPISQRELGLVGRVKVRRMAFIKRGKQLCEGNALWGFLFAILVNEDPINEGLFG